jgi:hypothetical protein
VLWSVQSAALIFVSSVIFDGLMALIALASRGGHQQKALFGDSFCIIFTLFMGQ